MKTFCSLLVGVALIALVGCGKTSEVTGPGGKKLKITGPAGTTGITQGETEKITVSVAREDFKGPIKVEVMDLPSGVSVVESEMTIPDGKNDITLTLKAEPDAAAKQGHVAKVKASAEGMTAGPVDFTIDVEKKG